MDQQVPDVYCDGVQINLSPVDTVMLLSKRSPRLGTTEPASPVAYVRMSLEQAKITAIVLRKILKGYEETLGGPIPIPTVVWQQLGLSPHDDW